MLTNSVGKMPGSTDIFGKIKLGFANKNEKKEFKENQNPSESIVSKIQKLFDLHKSGALNEEEFQMAKNILLSSET